MRPSLLLPLIMVFTFMLAGCSADRGPGITFIENSWTDALAKAKAAHKPIFLDIYASWCGPCKKLKRETFTDKAVTDYFNANFINVSLDGEQGDGAMMARQLRIQSYPSLFVLDENGAVLSASVGYQDATELLEFGKSARKDK